MEGHCGREEIKIICANLNDEGRSYTGFAAPGEGEMALRNLLHSATVTGRKAVTS